MANAVEAAFDQFHDAINLSGDHRATANARKDNVVSKLQGSFEILDSFSTGSIPKFTALSGHADLDVIVVLHYSKHIKDKTPTQVLQSVRDALSEWRTGARRNGQAVTLAYTTWPNVDIVPVSRTDNNDGTVSHYNVPNSNNDTWIQSRPRKHSADIESKSTDCGKNFRRIIKMIKHWNRNHSDYLQSYHIEVLALKLFSTNLDDTPWNVLQFFDKARPLLQTNLYHELGYVDDYLSANDRTEVLKRFNTAYAKALTSWHAGTKNDHATAIAGWKVIFGDKFPSYG